MVEEVAHVQQVAGLKHMIIVELENKHILCEHLIYIMEYKKIEVKHENKIYFIIVYIFGDIVF